MSTLSEEQARTYMHKLLSAMKNAGGSDLFIACDFPASMKIHGHMEPLSTQRLTAEITQRLAHSLMNERQREEFARDLEKGPPLSRVERVSVRWMPPTGRFVGFQIRYAEFEP